jgi:RHS repeat-associated protein
MTIVYTYNKDGIRTGKTVNGITTYYTLTGDKVSSEINETDTIYYRYDCNGDLISMNLNGTEYYYFRNAQGDIVGLFDRMGEVVVEYTYDAWGNILRVTGSLASTVGEKNPYLYRGYRYDNETGWYYLQSRYYYPVWGRFINADNLLISGIQNNVFSYCDNNPINSIDPTGHLNYSKIHDRVINDIVMKQVSALIAHLHIARSETKIKFAYKDRNRTKTGYGYCDIYTDDGQVWEVKNINQSWNNAKGQLDAYIRGQLVSNPYMKLHKGGAKIYGVAIKGNFNYIEAGKTYEIKYWYAGSGIIRYSITNKEDEEKKKEKWRISSWDRVDESNVFYFSKKQVNRNQAVAAANAAGGIAAIYFFLALLCLA